VYPAQGRRRAPARKRGPVIQSIQQRFSGARIEEAERKTRDGQAVLEVEIEVDGDDKEVTLTPDGQIIKVDD
jgi:uncharacterized membrane protein YkoI